MRCDKGFLRRVTSGAEGVYNEILYRGSGFRV